MYVNCNPIYKGLLYKQTETTGQLSIFHRTKFNPFKQNEFPHYCSFALMLNDPVNIYGHVWTVSSLNHTCFPGQVSLSGYPVIRAHTVA